MPWVEVRCCGLLVTCPFSSRRWTHTRRSPSSAIIREEEIDQPSHHGKHIHTEQRVVHTRSPSGRCYVCGTAAWAAEPSTPAGVQLSSGRRPSSHEDTKKKKAARCRRLFDTPTILRFPVFISELSQREKESATHTRMPIIGNRGKEMKGTIRLCRGQLMVDRCREDLALSQSLLSEGNAEGKRPSLKCSTVCGYDLDLQVHSWWISIYHLRYLQQLSWDKCDVRYDRIIVKKSNDSFPHLIVGRTCNLSHHYNAPSPGTTQNSTLFNGLLIVY